MGDEADRIIDDGMLGEIFGEDGSSSSCFIEEVYEGDTCPECKGGVIEEHKDEQGKYLLCPKCRIRWT